MTAFLPVAANIDANTKTWDNNYQTNNNMLESVSRVLTNQASKLSLPSKAFGNNVRVNLPHGNLLLGHTTLTLKISDANVPANAFLCQDWIYDAIKYVEFQFGNSEKLRYEGKHLLIKNLSDAESGEKKSVMSQVAGTKKTEAAAGGSKSQYVGSATIYLPFSNMSSSRYIPFDSSILSSPVEINIELARADEVFKFTNTNAAVVRAALPLQYDDAYMMCKTMYMVDGSSDSIREKVSMRGNDKYLYAYMYPQTFIDSKVLDGVPASVQKSGMSVDLTRFLNASCQSIDIFVERLTLGNAAGTPAGAPENASLSRSAQPGNHYVQITNCELRYAGQPIWRSDDSSDVLQNLSEYPTSTSFDLEIYQYNEGAGATLTQVPAQKGYWLHIQMSQFNERFFTNLVQSGVALNSNEVQFVFNTPELKDLPSMLAAPANPSIQPKYRVYANYNYQAGVRVAKGEANLVFQPPLSALPSISGLAGTF
jgi:hypothetical protein